MNIKSYTSFILALTIWGTASAQVPRTLISPIKDDALVYSINVGQAEQNVTQIAAYFQDSGNMTAVYEAYVDGPPGIKAEIRTLGLENADVAAAAMNPDGWNKVKLFQANSKEKANITLSVSSESSPYQAGNYKANVYFHFQKDACSGGKTTRYGGMILLNVADVDPARIAGGYTIRIALKEYPFTGDRASSIKPSSDGKYKGEPIVLMSSVEHYGREFINVVKWKGGKIASSRRIPVVKYVQYKDKSLSLGRINGLLSGGKATFELSNGGYIYGTCFTLTRRRQTANGYPM